MKKITFALFLWVVAAWSVSAAPVPYDLYNTGVNTGAATPGGFQDNSYTVVGPAGSGISGPAVVLSSPASAWTAGSGSSASKWISVANGASFDPAASAPPGEYTFSTTYTLPTTPTGQSYLLSGQWAVDNKGYITIGTGSQQYSPITYSELGSDASYDAFMKYHNISIPLSASGGSTTINFHVFNDATYPNPMAIRAELQIASVVHEAPTYFAGIGLLAILGFGWMFHPSRKSVIKSA
jgi:hypothetical protein